MAMVHALPRSYRRAEPSPCSKCGHPATLFHSSGKCWSCWSHHINTLKRPVQDNPYELDAIRAALRLKDDQSLIVFVASGDEFDDRWHEWWVEVLACRVPVNEPSMLNWSPWIVQFSEEGAPHATIRWRYWQPDTNGYLQLEWPLMPVSKPRIAFVNMQKDNLANFERLEKMLRNQALSGRPPGSGQPIDLKLISKLRGDGLTVEEIAPHFGLSRSQFFTRLRTDGIKVPPRGRRN